MLSTHTQHNTT